MFLSGVYMSQNHISESFFKFQNFPGRQATGPPPPPPPEGHISKQLTMPVTQA